MIHNNGLMPRPVSPEELAAALRAGLENRRLLAAPAARSLPYPNHPEPFQGLWPLSGLLGHPAPAASGLKRRAIRLLRRIARKLMAPWHDLQTRFNHALLRELQALDLPARDRELHDLTRRLEELQDRVNECHFKLESSLAHPLVLATSDAPVEAVESVFLQSRMPEPPGHVLALSARSSTVALLRAIGFTVLHAPAAAIYDLPLQPGAFRVILALDSSDREPVSLWSPGSTAARAAAARLLAPGGRIFGSAHNACPTGTSGIPAAFTPLRIVDQTSDKGVTVWAAEA